MHDNAAAVSPAAINARLVACTFRNLLSMATELNGNKPLGFDPNRGPGGSWQGKEIKPLMSAHILERFTVADILALLPKYEQASARARAYVAKNPGYKSPRPAAIPMPQDAQQQQQQQQAEPQQAEPQQQPAQAANDEGATVARVREIAREEAGKLDAAQMRTVQAAIAAALANVAPREIILKAAGSPDIHLAQAHPMAPKIIALMRAGLNVLMVGPAGSGKSTLARMIADGLKLPFNGMSLSAGASEAMFFGRLLPTGEAGRFEYHAPRFVHCYENAGVNFLDEMDAADGNLLVATNAATANGGFYCDMRFGNEYVKRHEHAYILAAANTFGTGADMVYSSREQLDGATLDRFYIVKVGYDAALESRIAGIQFPQDPVWQPAANGNAADRAALAQWVITVRQKIAASRMQRVASTRMLQKAMAAYDAGVPMAEIKSDLLAGWSRDELNKVGA